MNSPCRLVLQLALLGPLTVISPSQAAHAQLNHLYPEFEANGQLVVADLGGVLRSPELQYYELIRRLSVVAPLPDDIRKLLGWPQQDAYAPGAFAAGL